MKEIGETVKDKINIEAKEIEEIVIESEMTEIETIDKEVVIVQEVEIVKEVVIEIAEDIEVIEIEEGMGEIEEDVMAEIVEDSKLKKIPILRLVDKLNKCAKLTQIELNKCRTISKSK